MTTPDKQTFRDAMACVGAAVNIITTDGPAGLAGFTASAVCSVTDSPPTLLVCLHRGASVWPTFSENRTLCVNTLSAGQEPLSNLFGVSIDYIVLGTVTYTAPDSAALKADIQALIGQLEKFREQL